MKMALESYDANIAAGTSGTEYALWSGTPPYSATSYRRVTLKSAYLSGALAVADAQPSSDHLLQMFVYPGETGLSASLKPLGRCILSLPLYLYQPTGNQSCREQIAINPNVDLNPGDYITIMRTTTAGNLTKARAGVILDVDRLPVDPVGDLKYEPVTVKRKFFDFGGVEI